MTKDSSLVDLLAGLNADRVRAAEAAAQADAALRRILARFGVSTVDGVLACADELAQLRAREVTEVVAESPTSAE